MTVFCQALARTYPSRRLGYNADLRSGPLPSGSPRRKSYSPCCLPAVPLPEWQELSLFAGDSALIGVLTAKLTAPSWRAHELPPLRLTTLFEFFAVQSRVTLVIRRF